MPTTNRINTSTIRFNSGHIYLKDGSTDFENLGAEISAKLSRKTNTESITFMTGDIMKRRGTRECTLTVVVAQVDKSIQDRIDALAGKTVKLIIDNGKQGDKKQAYYFPQAEIVDQFDLEMSGGKHQSLQFDVLISPQAAAFSCTPSTDFPSEMGFVTATPVTNTNPFYIVVEE